MEDVHIAFYGVFTRVLRGQTVDGPPSIMPPNGRPSVHIAGALAWHVVGGRRGGSRVGAGTWEERLRNFLDIASAVIRLGRR